MVDTFTHVGAISVLWILIRTVFAVNVLPNVAPMSNNKGEQQ